MEFLPYMRKPFRVEAIEVTRENIHEISMLCGELVEKEGEDPYIQVDRKKVGNLYRIKLGFMLTKMGENLRAYSPEAFHDTFAPDNDGARLGLATASELLAELEARLGYKELVVRDGFSAPDHLQRFAEKASTEIGERST